MMEFQMKFFQSLYCPFITLHFDAQIVVENAMCIKCMGFFSGSFTSVVEYQFDLCQSKKFFQKLLTYTHTLNIILISNQILYAYFLEKKHYANQFFKFHKKFFFPFSRFKIELEKSDRKAKIY